MEQIELSKQELDSFLIDYIVKKNNSLGISASNIHHWNRNISFTKIKGRLKALSNKGLITMQKKAYYISDDEMGFVNIYFPITKEIKSEGGGKS